MSHSNGVPAEAPPGKPERYYGVLIVAPPGEPERYYDLDREVLRLGEAPDSDIRLERARVGDCEAIILCDEGGVSLVNTSAHDKLSIAAAGKPAAELPPGESTLLTNDSQITLGEIIVTLRLAPPVAPSEVEQPLLAEQLEMTLTPPICVAVAGETTELQLTIVNRTERVVSVNPVRAAVSAMKLPDDWINFSEIEVRKDKARDSVNPGESLKYDVRLTTPPEHNFSPDRQYRFGISATVQEKQSDTALPQVATQGKKSALASVLVAPFVRLTTDVPQTKVTAWRRGIYRITFVNRSNIPLPIAIQARDTANQLRLRLPRSRVTDGLIWLKPGETDTIRVSLTRRGWWPIGRQHTNAGALQVAVDRPALEQELGKLKGKAFGLVDTPQFQSLERAVTTAISADAVQKPASHDVTLITQPLPWWLPLVMLLLVVVGLLLAYPQIPATVAHIVTRRPVVAAGTTPLQQTVQLSGVVVPAEARPLAFTRSGTLTTTQGLTIGDCPSDSGFATGTHCTYVQTNTIVATLDTTELLAAQKAAQKRDAAAKAALAAAEQQQQRDHATAASELDQMMHPQEGVHLLNPNDILSPTVVISPDVILLWFPQHIAGAPAPAKPSSNDLAVELDPKVQAALRKIQEVVDEGAAGKLKAIEEQQDADAELGLRVTAKLTAQADFNRVNAKLKNSSNVTETQILGQMRKTAFDAVRALDEARLRVTQAAEAVDRSLAQDREQVNAAIASWLQARTEARGRLDAARQKVDALETAGPLVEQQTMDEASAALASIDLQIRASTIRSPAEGWVIASNIAIGDQVSASTPVLIFVPSPSKVTRLEASVVAELPPEVAKQAYDRADASIYSTENAANPISAGYQPLPVMPGQLSPPPTRQARLTIDAGSIPLYTPVQAKINFVLHREDHSLRLPAAAVQGQDNDRYIVVRRRTRFLGWFFVNLDNRVPVQIVRAADGWAEVTVHPAVLRSCGRDLGVVMCSTGEPPFGVSELVVMP